MNRVCRGQNNVSKYNDKNNNKKCPMHALHRDINMQPYQTVHDDNKTYYIIYCTINISMIPLLKLV